MTMPEMGRTAIELSAEDVAALQQFAELEDAAFEGYASDYAPALSICAGLYGR